MFLFFDTAEFCRQFQEALRLGVFPKETDLSVVGADQVDSGALIGNGLDIVVAVTAGFSAETPINDLFSVEVNNIVERGKEKNDHGGEKDCPDEDDGGDALPRGQKGDQQKSEKIEEK